jgi:hypothetical protein
VAIKHPFVTRENGAEFKINEAGRVEKSIYSTPYASGKPFTFHMKAPPADGKKQPPINITHYSRSVADYLNALIKNGFTILEVQEPMATPEMFEKQPRLAIRAFEPVHLLIRAVKKENINLLG